MIGYGQLVRQNKDFRYLWFGQIVSLLGDWFNLIASAALVAQLTQSGLAVGTLFVVRMLAPFVVSPIAGVVADRYDRKRILILADLARSLTVFAFLFVREPQHVWLLYTLTVLQLGIGGFFAPTYTAFLPDIVSSTELGTANALGSSTWSAMLALGAALGGLVSGILGIYTAFVIDGFTFLLSALFIARIAYNPAKPETKHTLGGTITEYIDGLRYLNHHLDIMVISMHKAFITLTMWSGMHVVQVTIAEKVFVIGEGGSISLGLMFGVNGLGTALGPIIVRSFTGDHSRAMRRMITVCYMISAAGLAISATLLNFPLVLAGIALIGFGSGVVWVFSTQLLLQNLPGQIRGRVLSVEFALSTLSSAIAAAISGSVLDVGLSVSQILLWMAGIALIPATLWSIWQSMAKSSVEATS